LVIIDDYSRRRWAYFLKAKSDAYQKIVEFIAKVEKLLPDNKVAIVRHDGGGEFVNIRLKEHWKKSHLRFVENTLR
jgi:predicted SnoaL-like aldol condensation-catalyzing enzyme